VLATDTQAPVVAETTVGPDLLQALEVITELRVDTVGKDLRVLAVDNVALPVEEPLCRTVSILVRTHQTQESTYRRDLVGGGILDDGDQALKLLRGELTGALLQVDIGLLADKVGCGRVSALCLLVCPSKRAEARGSSRVGKELDTYSSGDQHP
jgi:hypothetical protein